MSTGRNFSTAAENSAASGRDSSPWTRLARDESALSEAKFRTPHTYMLAQRSSCCPIHTFLQCRCSVAPTILCRENALSALGSLSAHTLDKASQHQVFVRHSPLPILQHQPIRVRVLQVRDASNPPQISGTPPSAAHFAVVYPMVCSQDTLAYPCCSGHDLRHSLPTSSDMLGQRMRMRSFPLATA